MAYRIGLIGLEQHVERVFAAVDNDAEISLVAVANAGEQAAELADKYEAAIHDDYHALLARDDIDVVASFQLPVHQGETVIAALEAGFPVLSEKPMVTSQEELDRVVAILQQTPSLHVGQLFSRRGNPVYRAVREVVSSGQIGEVALAYALIAATERRGDRPEWFFDRRLSAGPVLDLLIHDIDIVRWITGLEYASVMGTEGNFGRPDDAHYHNAGQLLFRMDGGVSAVMEHHRLVPPSLGRMDNRLKILGTEGQAEITHDDRVWLYRWDDAQELTDLPAQEDIFANFVRTACAGHDPIVSTQDAVQSMQATLCATEAGFTGTQQQVPPVPDLPERLTS